MRFRRQLLADENQLETSTVCIATKSPVSYKDVGKDSMDDV